MVRRVLVSLALVSSGLLGVGLSAPAQAEVGAAAKKPVKATVKYNADTLRLKGRLISKRRSCRDDRVITAIFRFEGEWQAQAVALTESDGSWSTSVGSAPDSAIKLRVYVPSTSDCGAGESADVTIRPEISDEAAAKKPATVTSTLQVSNNLRTIKGRLKSKRASCTKNRPVVLFYRQSGGEPYFVPVPEVEETNGQGRWRFDNETTARTAAAGGASITLFTYTPSTSACRLSESPRKTVTPPPL